MTFHTSEFLSIPMHLSVWISILKVEIDATLIEFHSGVNNHPAPSYIYNPGSVLSNNITANATINHEFSVASPFDESLDHKIMFHHVLPALILSLLNQKLQAVWIAFSVNVVTSHAQSVNVGWLYEMEGLVKQSMETDLVHIQLEEDVITSGLAKNLVYKFLVKTFCGSLGKGNHMELPECYLQGVRSLLKNKDHKERTLVSNQCLKGLNIVQNE